jgi:acetyl esterase/lipase
MLNIAWPVNSFGPAAVEDTRCALRWVYRNASQWHFDTTKIVLTGHSAGGHLALITGMLPDGTGLDNRCYGEEKLKVAAIINWYGISDVNDLIKGSNLKNYAAMWDGQSAGRRRDRASRFAIDLCAFRLATHTVDSW